MKATGDVVILGGGVIGLTTAYYLAREGCHVVVCDRGPAGREASWAGAGILPPSDPDHADHPHDRLRALSGRLFPTLSAELRERTGIDNEYHRCGGIAWAETLGEADAKEWHGDGLSPQPLSPEALADLEPAVAANLGPAVLIPGLAQLRNPRHLQALLAACRTTGRVELREGDEGTQLLVRGGKVRGVLVADARTERILEGSTILVTAGAWTDRLLEPLGIRLDIRPVRGQIALMNPGNKLIRHVLIWGARYLVPRLDGRLLVGSTEEHVDFDSRPTVDGIQGLLDFAVRIVPGLAHASLEKCWAGLRPGSPDGLPFIGRVPGVDNLFVAAGHFRSGIQLSPGTAWLLKEMILGQRPSLPVEPYRLERRRT